MKRLLFCIFLICATIASYAQRSEIKRRLVEDSASWYRYYFPDTVESVLAQHFHYNRKLFFDTTNDEKQNYFLILNRVDRWTWQLKVRYDSDVLILESFDQKLLKTVFRYTIIAGLKIPVISTEDYQFGRTAVTTDHDMTITFKRGKIIRVSHNLEF